MAGLLSGLAKLGLGNLENANIYEKASKEDQGENPVAQMNRPEEKDLVYDRAFECPVCGEKFTSKTMKTGKVKLIKTDMDLRPTYDGVDVIKYDVEMCPTCGYSALSRYFKNITSPQSKLIKENISNKVQLRQYTGDTYTYEEAYERYKLTLACAVVKRARASEKAYICLKAGWLLRGYAESLDGSETGNQQKITELAEEEDANLKAAYDGFIEARQSENFPICGMDEITVDYLIAVLAARFRQFEVASKLIASILTSNTANNRMKEKTRDLKDMVMEELKKGKS